MRKYLLCAWVLCLGHQVMICQPATYPPRDETDRDPSLKVFVERLLKAVEMRDAVHIRSLLDEQARSAVDMEGDRDGFMEDWQVADPESEFWVQMERVLKMGGVFMHHPGEAEPDVSNRYQVVFPYVYMMDLDIEADYFNIGVVTGQHVNVRSEPNTSARVLTQFSYHVVYYQTDEEGFPISSGGPDPQHPEWYKVSTLDNAHAGWVSARYLYDLMGPRLFLFKNKSGEWKISTFVQGD